MQKKTLFKNCAYLIKEASPDGIITNGAILVNGNTIESIGTNEVIKKLCVDMPNIEVVDCKNKLVMPGLVDGHNHLCNTLMNLARNFDVSFDNITEYILTAIHGPYGWHTEETMYDITTSSLLTSLKHGVTTINSCTILPDIVFRAFNDAKIRGILAPQMVSSVMMRSDNLNWKEYLVLTEECIKNYHNYNDGMIQVVVHPHTPDSCTQELQKRGYELAEKYDVKYATHFWEFDDQTNKLNKLFASEGGGIAYFDKTGLISDRCVFFHGSTLNEREIDLIGERGASIIHNPDINGTNCGMCAYVPYMIDAGVNVGLGSDYGSLELMTGMKLMRIIHNIMPRDKKKIQEHQPMLSATLGSAKAYGIDHIIGSLAVGKRADLITIDLSNKPELLPINKKLVEFDTSLFFLLFTRNAAALETCDVMVDGRFLRREGEFTIFDVEKITANGFKHAEKCMNDLLDARKTGKKYAKAVHREFVLDSELYEDLLIKRF